METKNIVITGGTRGIGLALAHSFLQLDTNVCICGTSDESVSNALTDLGAYADNIAGIPCNVANRAEVDRLWEYAADKMGGIDIWINNAGIGQRSVPAADLPPEIVQAISDVNIVGTIHGSASALNGMLAQGNGSIYNMEGFGSNGMIRGGLSVYGTSKRAVRYFTHALAKENKGSPITIGTLSPGMVLTDFLISPLNAMDTESAMNAKKVFNILADHPTVVADFLVRKIMANRHACPHIDWLPMWKVVFRFLTAAGRKNRLLSESVGKD